ncbi:DUF3013 family protein [Tetragenococcus solitarius]|uniref:DUF3013 family protein n=1 Tax=Tetragenococcus solitarius TaxID=71453 RepID=A0ABN3XZV2_9ENTE|nr:DUF3013 family protein [Tetragenococcus solitarius]
MAKETMLRFLEKQIETKLADYDTAVDWDVKNHTFEIILQLFAKNQTQEVINDAKGVSSDEEVIEFEDAILLYNPQKSQFNPDDFLAVIPFAGKKGMPKNQIAGLVDYIKDILDEGQSDLLDFLTSDQETFELMFNKDEWTARIKQGPTDYLPYPKY